MSAPGSAVWLAAHEFLTMTGLYNVLERLRELENNADLPPLTDKERAIHEAGLVSVLREIHDDIDRAREERRARRRKRRLRTIQTLPTLLTIGNLYFGFAAIYCCCREAQAANQGLVGPQSSVSPVSVV